MRISLHIVVALLLIALIYREILKGILPLVCGNPWQGMRGHIHAPVHPDLIVLSSNPLTCVFFIKYRFTDLFPSHSGL